MNFGVYKEIEMACIAFPRGIKIGKKGKMQVSLESPVGKGCRNKISRVKALFGSHWITLLGGSGLPSGCPRSVPRLRERSLRDSAHSGLLLVT